MIEFRVLKKSQKSAARLGVLFTPHGEVTTPALVPVATQAAVRTLTSTEVPETGTQMLIVNAFHLHARPGEQVVKRIGGLHRFMRWPHPLMTDSGGFQVFSLGLGRELGIGKVFGKTTPNIKVGAAPPRPGAVRITPDGAHFRSPLDGRELFLGPQQSIRIQEALGADIIFAFDECPPPTADYAYLASSLRRTHQWAEASLRARSSRQALFGIVQGGRYKTLRLQSARCVAALDFDGFGIGGEFGRDKRAMGRMLRWVTASLPWEKPRHLLGIGHPEDIPKIVEAGIDTFDCTVPTHYARHGVAFTARGRLDLVKSKFLKDSRPLDASCPCATCREYSRSYLAHLLRAGEITALRLLTFHNLCFFHALVERLRRGIKDGKL